MLPARNDEIPPDTPEANPPNAPAVIPALRASLKSPPAASVLIPEPAAAPNIGPRGVIAKAIGNTTGSAFLTTFTTFLTNFLTPLKSFLRKNSGCPVTGFSELSSLPTT